MMTNETKSMSERLTAEIGEHVLPYLQARIEKINKRARKNKLPEMKLTVIREFMKPKAMPHGRTRTVVELPFLEVELTGEAPKIDGYKFIATLEHQPGGTLVRLVPGEESHASITKFYTAKPDYCDHCKKIRRRTDTFVVREEKTNKLRQIGRNCLADFLGGANPKHIMSYFDGMNKFSSWVGASEAEAGLRGRRQEQFVDLGTVMQTGAAIIGEFGYMSKKKSQEIAAASGDEYYAGPVTTASDVSWLLFWDAGFQDKLTTREKKIIEVCNNPTEAAVKLAKDVVAWFESKSEAEREENEFMHNLNVLIKGKKINARNIGYLMALFPMYAKAMDLIKPKAAKANEWVGKVGDKITATVKVVRTNAFSNGFGTSTQIVSMEDEAGHALTWFNNSSNRLEAGETLTITGTVKKLDEFRGTKQTTLTRCKIAA